jgi:hypothetical protein
MKSSKKLKYFIYITSTERGGYTQGELVDVISTPKENEENAEELSQRPKQLLL